MFSKFFCFFELICWVLCGASHKNVHSSIRAVFAIAFGLALLCFVIG